MVKLHNILYYLFKASVYLPPSDYLAIKSRTLLVLYSRGQMYVPVFSWGQYKITSQTFKVTAHMAIALQMYRRINALKSQ